MAEGEKKMNGKTVLTICLSPTFQNTLVFDGFSENEVNRAKGQLDINASGKGINVLRVINDLGRKGKCIVQLGGPRVEEFLSICKDQKLDVEPVICTSPIRTCTTIINSANSTSTELVENAHPVDEKTNKAIRELFLRELPDSDALVISGTKAPGFPEDTYPWMVRTAKESGKLVILGIKGKELVSCLGFHPDYIKPNLSEFSATFFGKTVLENEDSENLKSMVGKKAEEIHRAYGSRTILSRGRFDTWAYDGESLITIPAMEAKVVNTIGCGDTMTAGMVHYLLEGRSFKDAIAFGMQCATRRATHLQHGLL